MSLTTVLAIGNPLFGDDGVGLVVLGALDESLLGAGVELLDGGTYGLYLLPNIEDADNLLILDAVTVGAAPGTVILLESEQVPRLFHRHLSPHHVGLIDVLAVARLRGREPTNLCVVGVEPESVELRWGLSETVARAVPEATLVAREILHRWSNLAEGDVELVVGF